MIRTLAAALATTTCLVALASPAAAQTREFNIPAGSLRSALDTFARQSGRQVIYRGDEVRSTRSPGVRGAHTAEEALDALLAGTGFRAQKDSSGAFAVAKVGNATTAPESRASSREDDKSETSANEIIVTGTNIRGIAATGSPVSTYNRRYIQSSGISSTENLIRSIPQNFGGGYTENSTGTLFNNANNVSFSNSPNLRGVGADATLTLLNGHRVAGANFGEATDVSLIPLALVDRVDVLLDGASALYGSDAVGGVVNFVLRKDFEGVETSTRYGSVTSGDNDEFVASIVGGHKWSSGHATIAYTYRDRSALLAADRDFASDALPGYTLLPSIRQHGVYGSFSQDIPGIAELSAEVLYGTKRVRSLFGYVGLEQATDLDASQLHAVVELRRDLGAGWQAVASSTFSQSRLDRNVTTNGVVVPSSIQAKVRSFVPELRFDGPLFELPGGPSRAAIGFQYRADSLASQGEYDTGGRDRRDAIAGYGELYFPFVGPESNIPGVRRLTVSLAGRYERYSDFGSTFNPKVGADWEVIDGFKLRGTYGTSFRAPELFELSTTVFPLAPAAYLLPDPASPSGQSGIVILYGNTGHLKPERSTNWTIGADIKPTAIPNLQIGLTYFNIKYRDRIGIPVTEDLISLLDHPERFGNLLTRNPPLNLIQSYLANPNFYQFQGLSPSDISLLLDSTTTNSASLNTSGLDVNASMAFDTSIGKLNLSANGSFLFSRQTKVRPLAESIRALNQPYYPVDFRMRAGASLDNPTVTPSIFLNYTDGYNGTTAGQKVSSWTTVDAAVQFNLSRITKFIPDGWRLSLSAINILDKAAPRVTSVYGDLIPVNYDPTNASPVGRFISVELTTKW